jgi:hypothetical protein
MEITKLTAAEGPAIGARKILRILQEQHNLRSDQQSYLAIEGERAEIDI